MDEVRTPKKRLSNLDSKVLVYIDARNNELTGKILFFIDNTVKSFVDLNQFMKILNQHFDKYNMPQSTHILRDFKYRIKKSQMNIELIKGVSKLGENIDFNKDDAKSTFLVHVMYRQNSSWQGKIEWVETGQKVNFRSSLELIKLLDQAINFNNDDFISWNIDSVKGT